MGAPMQPGPLKGCYALLSITVNSMCLLQTVLLKQLAQPGAHGKHEGESVGRRMQASGGPSAGWTRSLP